MFSIDELRVIRHLAKSYPTIVAKTLYRGMRVMVNGVECTVDNVDELGIHFVAGDRLQLDSSNVLNIIECPIRVGQRYKTELGNVEIVGYVGCQWLCSSDEGKYNVYDNGCFYHDRTDDKDLIWPNKAFKLGKYRLNDGIKVEIVAIRNDRLCPIELANGTVYYGDGTGSFKDDYIKGPDYYPGQRVLTKDGIKLVGLYVIPEDIICALPIPFKLGETYYTRGGRKAKIIDIIPGRWNGSIIADVDGTEDCYHDGGNYLHGTPSDKDLIL